MQDKKNDSLNQISWEFKEEINKSYSNKWYLGLFGIFTALVLIACFLMKSWSFIILLVVILVSVLIYIKTPKKDVKYLISGNEIFIDDAKYLIADYKSFGILKKSGNSHSIVLIPVKRLSPALILDFSEEYGEGIVDFFGARLPMQEVSRNFIDKIVDKTGL